MEHAQHNTGRGTYGFTFVPRAYLILKAYKTIIIHAFMENLCPAKLITNSSAKGSLSNQRVLKMI